jgi:S-adenosylhomocysteine hydrolase
MSNTNTKQNITLRKMIKNNDTYKTIQYSAYLTELTESLNKDLESLEINNQNVKLNKKELKNQKKYISTWFTKWELLKNIIKYN